MKTKIMFILALAGLAWMQADAQQCVRPVKKAKVHHTSSRVVTVKKIKPVDIAMVSAPAAIVQKPGPLCLAPAPGRCIVGENGDITHCFTKTWTGANGNVYANPPVARVVVRSSDHPWATCTNPNNRDFLMACESPGTVRVEVNGGFDYSACATGTCVIPTPLAPICLAEDGATTHCALNRNGEIACSSSSSWSGYYSSETIHVTPRFGNSLVISSTAFNNGGALPSKYTCEGQQVTPPLTVGNLPEGTQTLAVILYDPKATATQSHTYWMAWNITSSFIPENFRGDYMARNPYSKYYGYTAICPVSGDHEYHFAVFALDKKLSLSRDASREMFEDAVSGHVLASGEIIGTYQRVR